MEADLARQFQNAQTIAARDELCHGRIDSVLLGFKIAQLHGLLDEVVIQF